VKYINSLVFTWVNGELTDDTWTKYWGLIQPAVSHLNELLLKDYYLGGAKPTIIDFRVVEAFTRVHLINDKCFGDYQNLNNLRLRIAGLDTLKDYLKVWGPEPSYDPKNSWARPVLGKSSMTKLTAWWHYSKLDSKVCCIA